MGLPFVRQEVDGVSVVGRLEMALEWLLAKRQDATTGLLWGATTLDWVRLHSPVPSDPSSS